MTMTSTPQLQRKFPLRDKTLCPVLTVSGVRSALPGHDEDDVLALIEDGSLEWAWNIALHVGDGIKKEPRILKSCVERYGSINHQPSTINPLSEFFNGDDKPFLFGTTLRLLFNCSSTHVIALIEAKELRVQPGSSWDRGPGNSPLVTRSSVEAFMKRRRMT